MPKMIKCSVCNEEIAASAKICPKCGAMVDNYVDHKTYMDVYHVNHGKRIRNKKLILWFLLGLILPYIGFLVSWIMYDGERDRAKAVLLGAIVSSIISMVLPYVIPLFLKDDSSNNDTGNSENNGQVVKNLIDLYKSL